jgi:hypothetical protein
MKFSEYILDKTTEYAVDLQKLGTFETNRALRLLKELELEVVKKIEGANLTSTQTIRYKNIIIFIEKITTDYYDKLAKTMNIDEIAVLESQFLQKVFNEGAGFELIKTMPTITELRAVINTPIFGGRIYKDMWKNESGNTIANLKKAIQYGVFSGEENEKIIQRIRGTRKANYTDGIMQTSRRNAETIIRTSIAKISNASHDEFGRKNSDIMKCKMQVSTFDLRTSNICVSYSGAKWDMKNKPVDGNSLPYNGGTPRHPNCRSRIIFVPKSLKELGLSDKDLPESTRASLDGSIPENLTFDDWLKTKSPVFVDKLLGRGRSELYRAGKIKLRDLIAPNGESSNTIEELKRKW